MYIGRITDMIRDRKWKLFLPMIVSLTDAIIAFLVNKP